MNHLHEDQILKYMLDTLDSVENKSVKNHLENCKKCTSLLHNIKSDFEIIDSYNPHVEYDNFLPQRNKIEVNNWLKVAAVLVLGFLTGYLTSNYTKPDQVTVVAQTLIPQSPQIDSSDYIVCPNIDIY